MTCECALEARSYECDVHGHVNNAVYLNYLEHARYDFMRQAGIRYEELRARGYGLVVSRIRIDFKSPVRRGDGLRVLTAPLAKDRVRCVFSQRIYRAEELVADAEVAWACVGPDGRPVRLPPELDVPELEP
jgi:acyl-CoA thioester hydrolase